MNEGKSSKSKKPKKEKIESKKISAQEFEKKILEFADKGMTSEKIGEALRKEGIHPKDHNKKISKILKENNKYVNPDLKNIEEKLKKIVSHYEKNKQDKKSMREKDRVFAQLRIAKAYFSK